MQIKKCTSLCECKNTASRRVSKEYRTWRNMRDRCLKPNNPCYNKYREKGIKICEEWNDFYVFLADMGKCPEGGKKRYSLERIDQNGDYTKENCRWAYWKTRIDRRKNNVMITAFGKTQTLVEWAREKNIFAVLISRRIKINKMTPEEALSLPVRISSKKIVNLLPD